MINALADRNDALKNYDFKTLYIYIHPSERGDVDIEEFERESKKTVDELYQGVTFTNHEILNTGKIQKCNSQYQCIIFMKTHMNIDNKESFFTSKIIALSDNGSQWTFINAGDNDLQTIKKLYPVVCLME